MNRASPWPSDYMKTALTMHSACRTYTASSMLMRSRWQMSVSTFAHVPLLLSSTTDGMERTICIRFIDYRSLTGLLDAVASRVGSFVWLLWPLGRLALLGFHVRSPPCWCAAMFLPVSGWLILVSCLALIICVSLCFSIVYRFYSGKLNRYYPVRRPRRLHIELRFTSYCIY